MVQLREDTTDAAKDGALRLAVVPGDGVGPEVIAAAIHVLEGITGLDPTFRWEYSEYPWGANYFLEHGVVMPDEALDELKRFDAILLGAVGDPRVPDHIPAAGSVIRIRQAFDQWVNLRPVKLLRGAPCPLKDRHASDIDFVVVRENSEGEYVDAGGRSHRGFDTEVAVQTSIFTRHGVERIITYAFELAAPTGRSVTNISKGNALRHSLVMWDEIFEQVAARYPDVEARSLLADAAAMFMVRDPGRFEVVVTTNMLGDILTDLGAALQGGMGFAASANLNPERIFPSMFEPIHGAAPDIAGRGQANPIATLWSVQLMLDFLGYHDWSERLMGAIEGVVADGAARTPDMGGTATTSEVAAEVRGRLR